MKHLRWRAFALLHLLAAYSSFAQIAVRVEKPARLFAQPNEKSMVLTEVGGRANFRALEQSGDRKWIFISDGLRYGWIRKVFVSATDEATAALSESGGAPVTKESVVAENAPPDADLPAEEDLDDAPDTASEEDNLDDPSTDDSDIYLVKVPGTFYEQAKKNTQKFGKLEPNDKVELLANSQDDKWVRVRLIETGEEGWIPRSRIGRKIPRTELKEFETAGKLNHFGIQGVVAPEPWNFGAAGYFRRGFPSLAIGGIPIELGVGFGYHVGTVETFLNTDIEVTYFDMRGFVHWEPLLSSRFSIPIQLGLLYKYGIISTELSEEQFEAVESRILASEFGGYVGVGLGYYLFDWLNLEVMPQMQLTTTVDFVVNAGLVLSF